jgi:predicted nucleic acid-binding protein
MISTSRRLDVSYERELHLLRSFCALLGFKPAVPEQSSAPKAARYLAALAEAYGPLPATPFPHEPPLVRALTFDATGLAALARGDVRARAYLARAVGSIARILVPATALLEPRLAAVADAIAEIVELDESVARSAAQIMNDARLTLPLDALLVACAARERSTGIVTADSVAIGDLVRAAALPELHVFAL